MGLAGRKDKQRIGDDPRNTRWANDTSNPGYKMLSGMGWTPSTGLGGPPLPTSLPVTGAGLGSSTPGLGLGASGTTWKRMPTAILPTAKADTRGLGASLSSAALTSFLPGSSAPTFVAAGKAPMNEQDGAASKTAGGGALGDLFARLNKASASATSSGVSTPVKGVEDEEAGSVPAGDALSEKAKRKAEKALRKARKAEKKRKRGEGVEAGAAEAEEVVEVQLDDGRTEVVSLPTAAAVVAVAPETKVFNPRMASRAKYLASKRLASASNAAAMAEILGLSHLASPSHSPSPVPPSTPAPAVTEDSPKSTSVEAADELNGLPRPKMTFVKASTSAAPAVDPPAAVDVSESAPKEKKEKKKEKKRKRDTDQPASTAPVDLDRDPEPAAVTEPEKADKKRKKRKGIEPATPNAESVAAVVDAVQPEKKKPKKDKVQDAVVVEGATGSSKSEKKKRKKEKPAE